MPPPFRHPSVTAPAEAAPVDEGLVDGGLPAANTRWSARQWQATARRWAARLALALPGGAVIAVDVTLRHARLGDLTRRGLFVYGASALLTIALWGSLLAVAARRRGIARWVAVLLVTALALLAVGGQLYSYGRYHAYLNDQAVLVGTSMLPSIGQQLWFDRLTFARTIVPPFVVALVLTLANRLLAPTRARPARAALDIAVISLVLMAFAAPRDGEQNDTPDLLYVNSLGRLLRARWDHDECVERVHPGPRTPRPLPLLTAKPAAPRNVLLVLTESVRAMSTCVSYDADCIFTPFSNAAAPGRIALNQMRSVDSTTAISLAVMWNGLAPIESREDLHSAPLIWEYAHAAGTDTAYWTSQNLLFGNSGQWLEGVPLSHHLSATEIDDEPTLETGADDGKLVTHVIGDLGDLREPFFGVVHMSNTHFPYVIGDDPPFVPESGASGPGYDVEIRNRYQDAIYMQDKAVARLIHAVRASAAGERTVIVFLSDHGEQMREKGAVGHTGTLFDPEIRIPAWVDAPRGTLTAEEDQHLRSLEEVPLTTLDVMPTLLDLVGLWDAPEIAPMRDKMPGQSLLRGGSSPDRAVVLTNCSSLWACAFKNWGAMQGTKKLIATQVDHAWGCYDVANDPEEVADLGASACGPLQALAEGALHGRPF